jgi:hypothetical protein
MIVTALTKACDYNKPHAVSRKRVQRVLFLAGKTPSNCRPTESPLV